MAVTRRIDGSESERQMQLPAIASCAVLCTQVNRRHVVHKREAIV